MNLSETERSALEFLRLQGGCVLTSVIPDTNQKNMFGDIEAGMGVYKKLDKKGLVVITEEDPCEDGFVFTNEIYLTDEGKSYIK